MEITNAKGVLHSYVGYCKKSEKTFIGEIQNKRKNGEIYTALVSVSPVVNKEGNVVFFVGIESDITKEKEIDRAKSEFVSLASHQLRTPLSAINWYTELLLDEDAGKLNGDQKKYANQIATSSKRMVALVNSLLNVSRIDLGTALIKPEMSDIKEIADGVIEDLEHTIAQRSIKFSKKYDKIISPMFLDPKIMHLIIDNVLSNAVKYTNEGGKVHFEIKKDESGVLLSIADSGIGVPSRQKDLIYKKLFRADNAVQSETDGTGLGLYMVKSLLDTFDGKIWFDSIEGEGSTFYIHIPETGMKPKVGEKTLD